MSAWSRLHAATLELTKGTSLKQRLASAFSKHLCRLDPIDLPAELRAEFTELVRGLESVRPLPGESAVQATVRKMSGEEADRYAARIVRLFGNLAARGAVEAGPVVVELPAPRFEEHERARGAVPLLYAAEA
jgi:hypothetical protein